MIKMIAAPNISSACYPPARFSQSGHEPKSSSFNNCAWMLQNLRTRTNVVWLYSKILDTTIFSIGTELHRNLPLSRITPTANLGYNDFISSPKLLLFLRSLPSLPVPLCFNASLPHFSPSLPLLAAKISSSPCSSLCFPHSTTSSCRGCLPSNRCSRRKMRVALA